MWSVSTRLEHARRSARYAMDLTDEEDLPCQFKAGFVLGRPLCYPSRQPGDAIWGNPVDIINTLILRSLRKQASRRMTSMGTTR